ncbi:MAG: hypothetical protein JRJ49_02910 [Deltaproteobacteria bacterium]|nr:hypothetical protein [Deltaproteobacteria bacterium]
MPIKDLIEFILYLAPGFIASELYNAKYPVKERGQFVQITWSIIWGIIILSVIRWVDEKFFSFALNSNSESFPSFRFIIALFGSGLLLGIIRIYLYMIRFKLSLKYNSFRSMAPDPQSIWVKINQKENTDWAVVFLNDNCIYLGWISNYTYNPNNENQDFLLSSARRVDENLEALYTIDGKGVYLNTRDVKRIEFIQGQS